MQSSAPADWAVTFEPSSDGAWCRALYKIPDVTLLRTNWYGSQEAAVNALQQMLIDVGAAGYLTAEHTQQLRRFPWLTADAWGTMQARLAAGGAAAAARAALPPATADDDGAASDVCSPRRSPTVGGRKASAAGASASSSSSAAAAATSAAPSAASMTGSSKKKSSTTLQLAAQFVRELLDTDTGRIVPFERTAGCTASNKTGYVGLEALRGAYADGSKEYKVSGSEVG